MASGAPGIHAGHDERLLAEARRLVKDVPETAGLRAALLGIVADHEAWRARRCINLVAAESPTSPGVRNLLASDLGCRASGGHIGAENRFFAGLDEVDRLEALCIAVLADLFSCTRADPRLLGGMHASTVVYAALKHRGATVMSLPEWAGGDTSNREDGPPGALGYAILDIPMHPGTMDVDLDRFEDEASRTRPAVVSLGAGINLFPFPVAAIADIVHRWGGVLYFDGAHQAGLVAGGCYPNPLGQGADILSGSTGKTFSGPQGGLLCWNDERFTESLSETIFPVLTGTHQLNRVAALTLAALELREFGEGYMARVVANAQALGRALDHEGLDVLGSDRNYTETHQVVIRAPAGTTGGGHGAARRLAEAGIVANQAMIPSDRGTGRSGGVRFGTVEVTRLGMAEAEMALVARLVADRLLDRRPPHVVAAEAGALRSSHAGLKYCWA